MNGQIQFYAFANIGVMAMKNYLKNGMMVAIKNSL